MSGLFSRTLVRRSGVVYGVLRGVGVVSSVQPVSVGALSVGKRFAATLAVTDDPFDRLDTFARRHSGSQTQGDLNTMLETVGVKDLDELSGTTVPSSIQAKEPLKVGDAMTETEAIAFLKNMVSKNKLFQNHIGMGYYGTNTPYVILRNLLENPAWYTQYTPYQAEVAQGRLESLLNFQTMVSDLTGLPVSSASLLDEGTAAAEAMSMCFANARGKLKKFFVSELCHPQTIAIVQTRAPGFGVEIVVGDHQKYDFSNNDTCGILLQYPATDGTVEDYRETIKKAQSHGAKAVVATDLLALTMLTPPGELGADFALGSSQRFGVPMGYGGPHAAFFSTKDEYKRLMPGRIIGLSKDAQGKPALRMAMQTREQHIRRDKATSNICTAQALLANMAAMYGVYHGPEGLKKIAERTHLFAQTFAKAAEKSGIKTSETFFDTVRVEFADKAAAGRVLKACAKEEINVRQYSAKVLTVSFDETHTKEELKKLIKAFGFKVSLNAAAKAVGLKSNFSGSLFERKSDFMTHPIFNSYHTEHELLRYLMRLQNKDISLVHSMIPLGSCTMKLNSTSEMIPVTWPEICLPHPFVPPQQVPGYYEMFAKLEKDLADITGFHKVSLQPNSGAQGEYTGLMTIKAYHESRGDHHRNICLIPTSAHGTNPASAKMCGMRIVPVGCDSMGNIDVKELRAKAEQYRDELSSLMITYPSTHGVFEETIKEICDIIHTNGGQVYMDGANMNAQVGLTSPGLIGADVCHLNLHKTFCIPHGGGGPGMGPIGVAKQLSPFLPTHPVVGVHGADKKAMGPVSAAPYGSSAILPISFMYINMMGSKGLKEATQYAILNANYMKKRLEKSFNILYTGKNGRVAHEFIIDIRPIKAASGITEADVAKRLQDYGFHAPTMSWPVSGTLMVEPTESESKAELDRFCDALLMIRDEIRQVENGSMDRLNNPLKNAPHSPDVIASEEWDRPYSREVGAFPAPWSKSTKFWPTVGRLDDVYGDRQLICTCPPMEALAESA
eukprot:Plantae.Rhodophyta-Purpureofilum_apyrenoidigerum.ctg5152.p1 GENE.Plantae.Rhodophyta-Purpureofilum_apyrenoidigerum.ctg5152~~Plantae.Rhodophyta-Purpureofilum_apyrenoidigerum.ctg5152.p1  ORF type:complete len:1011 (+),score=184.07 Plantae.Rhodophyta-Purpureofilum_apyrenoidigerum.ctg5152:134-3166(+)